MLNRERPIEELKFYLIKNEKGQYFIGQSLWSDHVDIAKVYHKIGHVRAAVTDWVKYHLDSPCPTIIELSVQFSQEIEETARVEKVLRKQDGDRFRAAQKSYQVGVERLKEKLDKENLVHRLFSHKMHEYLKCHQTNYESIQEIPIMPIIEELESRIC